MTVTDPSTTDLDPDLEAQVGAYAEHLFGTGLAAFEAVTISLGRELGLYDRLTDTAGTTAEGLAAGAGIDARYAREWLEQQAAAGLIDLVAADDDPDRRRFALSLAGQECLLQPSSPASVGPLFDFMPAVSRVFPNRLVDAFRTGAGIPYADYAAHDAQGGFNRPVFDHLLTADWLPAVPGVAELVAAGPVRVAEIGCGEGWAAIAIATMGPEVTVDGFDDDDASIAAARKHAAEAGVSDRVRFEVVDVTAPLPDSIERGTYDLVVAVEMIHDLARPVDALATMRTLGTPDAIHLVVDENAAEAFVAPSESPIERFFYAASVLHCLPVGRAGANSAATGTVMRPATLRAYADAAGFATVDILPIDHDLFRLYHLQP